jgi:hypothetical protein
MEEERWKRDGALISDRKILSTPTKSAIVENRANYPTN